jgi:CRISPR-associated protein Csb2
VFQIAVNFVTGRCHAARWEDPSLPDWPIDPARIFSAMVAGVPRLGDPDRIAAARQWLEWFERLAPPTIFAVPRPQALATPFTYAVSPTEMTNKYINPNRDKVHLTATPLIDPVVLFRYDSDLPETLVQIVQELLSCVTYVGSSESLALMYLSDDEQHARHAVFQPDPDGDVNLRVPYVGRLVHLDAAFADLQRRDRKAYERRTLAPGKLVRYTADRRSMTLRSYSDMGEMFPLIFGRDSRFDVDILRFTSATRSVRAAFLHWLGDNGPEELTGHKPHSNDPTDSPHVAFVPLAEVGFEYATGRVRGVAMVLPRRIDGSLRDRAARLLQQIEGVAIDGKQYKTTVDLNSRLFSLSTSRYRTESLTWATATPIVLPRYPRRAETVESIIASCFTRNGLVAPSEIMASHVPFVDGSIAIGPYRSRVPGNRYVTHARLVFDSPLRGPLMLGRHRHEGYGLCLPAGDISNGSSC